MKLLHAAWAWWPVQRTVGAGFSLQHRAIMDVMTSVQTSGTNEAEYAVKLSIY